ncbi:MAG TPA: TerB family tellurite resistance protein [Brachyspira hyodysenteriae]|nr:TerB family tellurite resistance protein [Brachyspira hyodysenteriae]
MFLSELCENIYDEDEKKKVARSLAAFMAVDNEIDEDERKQIDLIYFEMLGRPCPESTLNKILGVEKEKIITRFKKIIDDNFDPNYRQEEAKKFLFEIISCALCNNQYDDYEKEVVNAVAKKCKVDNSVVEEMKDMINTVLVLNERTNEFIFNERI